MKTFLLLAAFLSSSVNTYAAQPTVADLSTYARAQVAQLQAQLDAEKKKAQTNMDADYPCRARKIKLNRIYFQWFIDHVGEFKKLEDDANAIVKEVNTRLKSLETAQVDLMPLKGQNSSSIAVNLKNLLNHVGIYNRMKKAQGKTVSSSYEIALQDPELNPAGVTPDQLTSALDSMIVILNASLRQARSEMSIIIVNQEETDYDVQLSVTTQETATARSVTVNHSLLGKDSSLRLFNASSIWQSYIDERMTIDGQAISGNRRYLEMVYNSLDAECNYAGWNEVGFDGVAIDDLRLLSNFDAVNAAVWKVLGPIVAAEKAENAKVAAKFTKRVAAIRAQKALSNGVIYRGKAYDVMNESEENMTFRDLQTGELTDLGMVAKQNPIIGFYGKEAYVFALLNNDSLFFARLSDLIENKQSAEWTNFVEGIESLKISAVKGGLSMTFKDMETGKLTRRNFNPKSE